MSYKDTPSSAISGMQDSGREESGKSGKTFKTQLENLLTKMGFHLKGADIKEDTAPDPAAQIIMEIEDVQVRSIVRLLHYRTPRTLKTMRESCQKCFILPEDCPYVDYTILDVKKAVKQLQQHPFHIELAVITELAKVNAELAGHLREALS
jgi:hypothetical protein